MEKIKIIPDISSTPEESFIDKNQLGGYSFDEAKHSIAANKLEYFNNLDDMYRDFSELLNIVVFDPIGDFCENMIKRGINRKGLEQEVAHKLEAIEQLTEENKNLKKFLKENRRLNNKQDSLTVIDRDIDNVTDIGRKLKMISLIIPKYYDYCTGLDIKIVDIMMDQFVAAVSFPQQNRKFSIKLSISMKDKRILGADLDFMNDRQKSFLIEKFVPSNNIIGLMCTVNHYISAYCKDC